MLSLSPSLPRAGCTPFSRSSGRIQRKYAPHFAPPRMAALISSGRRRAPGERVNVAPDDGILSVKPQKTYEFPHNVFFAVVVEVAF